MNFDEIIEIVKAFLAAIANVFKMLGLDKLFNKKDEATKTDA